MDETKPRRIKDLATPTPSQDAGPIVSALNRSRSRWRALAFIAVALVLVALTIRTVGEQASQGGGDYIARLVVEGVIATSPGRLATIERLAEDDSVKAVIVRINSPGGTTAGGEELYEALMRLNEEKPVVAVINELGASAAYMTAIATDRIFARRLSLVGSVGVLYQHINAGGLMQTIGVDIDKVASGELKAEPDMDEPLEGAARDSFQDLVDDSFAWFLEVVQNRRGLDDAQLTTIADGRILNGRAALDLGLIDEYGGEAEALKWLSTVGVGDELNVRTVWPLPSAGIERWLELAGSEARSAVGLDRETLASLDGLVSLWQAGQ